MASTPDGSATLTPEQVRLVLGALLVAAWCADHHFPDDIPAADVVAYRSLARSLGDDR